jgi:L-rhamnose mutarotase
MLRLGATLKLRPGVFDEYRIAHAAVWPEVLEALSKANVRNYSIYYKDDFLFSYYEYHGGDYAADMAAMASNPDVQRWWDIMGKLQEPLPTRKCGEWWASMEELFHMD